ncbi:protein CURLY FLAG LEAF 1-like [Musa acuminata AAA Group]|uniref:protein CURLY FLAG LEAF 1 n=1 Tax=Musa acuminata AAA Group TaxID=214697 RepID=UPI0031E221F8
MTRPNIDMITASLRNCSLRRGRREPKPPPLPRRQQQRRHLVEDSDEIAGVTVELNSGTALPHNWEQYLDMRTGEVYYINWETGIRTTEDPRNSTIASSYSDEGEASDDEDSGSSYDASGETTGSSYDASGDTPGSSSLSSASSTETSASVDDVGSGGGGGHVLVAAGCRACFTYFMVPKRAHVCPSCGGRLFHLGNNGSS